jgi:hypothetical protein
MTRYLLMIFALCLAMSAAPGCVPLEEGDDPVQRDTQDSDDDDDDGYDPAPTCCECNCSACSATVTCTPDCGSCYSACQDACTVCGGVIGASEC